MLPQAGTAIVTQTLGMPIADALPRPTISTSNQRLNDIQPPSKDALVDEEFKDTKTEASTDAYTTPSQLNFEPIQGTKRQTFKATITELRIDESIFPPLPPRGLYGTFQCTQCFEILPEAMRKKDLWK
jgi:hypothetical protein